MSKTTTLPESGPATGARRTRQGPMRPRAPPRRSRRPPSGAARRGRRTCRSRSSSAASATRTCTRCATSGRAPCRPSTPASRATRSSAAWSKAGSAVRKFKEGDLAAVGCMVDSCRTCASCREGLRAVLRRACRPSPTTFPTSISAASPTAATRRASSSTRPSCCASRTSWTRPASAPLLCAGITTYSPLRHWKVGKGQKVGVVGLGGLGHMAVKFASAFGASVVAVHDLAEQDGGRDAPRRARSRGLEERRGDARSTPGSFDFILDTVSAAHDLNAYLDLLKRDGTLTLVGAPEKPLPVGRVQPAVRAAAARRLGRSAASGRPRRCWTSAPSTASRPTSSVIPIQKINEAYERLLKSDVKYRFVIDMASLK